MNLGYHCLGGLLVRNKEPVLKWGAHLSDMEVCARVSG